jgi:membrane protein DedA with SNARE-associated domain
VTDPPVPPGDGGAEGVEEGAERPRPSRRTLVLLVAPIVVITGMGLLATAFTPALATRHPLLLITLDARNRFLVLARHVDLVPFVVVAVLRRSFSDPLFYLLGRIYGDGAVRWIEKKGGGGELVVLTEKLFKRAAYPMVFLFPGSIVCALAGQTGMSAVGFVAANLAGTLTSVLLVRRFSSAISSPVEGLLRFFNHHLVATTCVSVGLVVLSLVLNRISGKLDVDLDELEGAASSAEPAGGSDVEKGVQADGDAGVVGDRLHGEHHTGHE